MLRKIKKKILPRKIKKNDRKEIKKAFNELKEIVKLKVFEIVKESVRKNEEKENKIYEDLKKIMWNARAAIKDPFSVPDFNV